MDGGQQVGAGAFAGVGPGRDLLGRTPLTEGGVKLREDTRNIVIELSRRGIVNSICSKNDFDIVRNILVGDGVWDYFVLP